jgi:plastocyanin
MMLWMGAATAVFACALHGAEPPAATTEPATQPSTQPLTGSVRGHVSIDGGWLFSKPDLSRVVVYVGSAPALDGLRGPTTRAIMSQHEKRFEPNFLVIQRGTSVEFPNWDRFYHNVFSRSAAAPAFDLDRYPYGQSKTRTFDKLGVVQLFCNIHPQMRAVIYVAPNRFFARAQKDGSFEIADVPVGQYKLMAWDDRCDPQSQPIEIKAGETADVSFELSQSHDRVANTGDGKQNYGIERGLGVKREKLNLPVVRDSHPAPEESRP